MHREWIFKKVPVGTPSSFIVPSLGDRIDVCLGCGGESYVILASGIGPDSGPMNELRDENIEVESSLLGSILEFSQAQESEQIACTLNQTVKLDLTLCQSY